jgi:NAD(P)H-dependent FMN reductase
LRYVAWLTKLVGHSGVGVGSPTRIPSAGAYPTFGRTSQWWTADIRESAGACPSLTLPLPREFDQSICEAPEQICERLSIRFTPIGKRLRQEAAPSERDRVDGLFAIVGQSGCPASAVRSAITSLDELEAFQLGELATDGGVVTPHLISEFRHAQRTKHAQSHQQWKQRAIEGDPGLAQQGVVALRTVQEAHEFDNRGTQPVDIACILHLYSAPDWLHIACMIHTSKVLVIAGSVRPRRICPQIAAWVAQVGQESVPASFEVVDLREWPLPMDDEPDVPARGGYVCEHTRAWSGIISAAHAFVFVTPQYNWGYPAPLKNALDHLYKEWSGKPAMIVTYGGHGGDKCATQLRQVLDGLKLKPLATMPGFRLARERIEVNAGAIEPAREFADHLGVLQQAFTELASALARA